MMAGIKFKSFSSFFFFFFLWMCYQATQREREPAEEAQKHHVCTAVNVSDPGKIRAFLSLTGT